MSDGIEIVELEPSDHDRVQSAAALFDQAPQVDAIDRFLQASTHHLLIAYAMGVPAGFVSGVEMTHPDKGTEMFLYELGVDEAARRRGIGTALVETLAAVARDRGCRGMWVITDAGNAAATGTYSKAGGHPEATGQVVYSWSFGPA